MSADSPPDADPVFSEMSGKWVVIALFAFGLLATGLVWTYWKVTRAPFFELQKALAKEFPKSTPRVDGGQPKEGPMTLSVVLHVDYPPDRHDTRVTSTVLRVLELASGHQNLTPYKLFDVYLIQKRPERTVVRLKATFQAADVATLKPGVLPQVTFDPPEALKSKAKDPPEILATPPVERADPANR